ncbi:MAG: Flp pilus assembly complex ATPase component TadA [Gemmatimonadetes bacterium]|nr:Flp pilus assembly complex ATPase component TadA [Gemmatimonadota bacterium]
MTPDSFNSSSHWMVRIAGRAGLLGDVQVDLPPQTSAEDAWRTVAKAAAVSEAELSGIVAEFFRMTVADFSHSDPTAFLLVPEELARRLKIFPVSGSDRQLVVATADPTDMEAERMLAFTSGRKVVFQVASPRAIKNALDDRFSPEKAVEDLLGNLDLGGTDEDAVKLVEAMGPETITEGEVQATPVVKLTNLIIRDGISQGASDVHIEPGRRLGTVRYRVDGVLRKHMDLPMSALNRVISRVKILSKLDITDRLRPQDGKARVQVGGSAYDLRVSTLPAGGAEKCVIRVLDSDASVTLEDLQVPEYELNRLRQLLGFREGIVVVTGPTGSGKTTTLYGALRELADGRVNIMTVEDPIEYELPSITQTQVETKQGLTFASALRSILRQDPDVILVGEIRDRETAETAAQAAMTGHLVLATVHANDAVSSVPRLVDLGLQYSVIASTLRGTLAQRLLRRVCTSCAESVGGKLTEEEERLVERHGVEPKVRAVGCPECGFSGYRGRLPVMEVLIMSHKLGEAIEARKGSMTMSKLAQQGGMRTMHAVGLDCVEAGATTLVEVERVLGESLEELDQALEEAGPPRILLVDDEEDARVMMKVLLEKEGYHTVEATTGHEAIDILQVDPDFSLVILDLAMPAMDGKELLNSVRGSVDTAALPVLIRTGTETEADEAALLDAGADDFVTKSAGAARFLARVKAVIRRSRL